MEPYNHEASIRLRSIEAMTFKPRLGTLSIIIFLVIVTCSQAQQSIAKQRLCLEPCLCHGDRISCRDGDLEEIPPFVTINGAHIVDLSKNNILGVDRNSFSWAGTIQLQFLYLSTNTIVYVESGAFDDLLNLQHVDLSNNELQFVPADIVAENGRMRVLNLAQNLLVREVPIIISDSLQVLDLSWNKLDTILPETFNNLPNLERLELQSNNFQYISTETFLALPNLMYIDLNINMWPCNCSSQKLFDFVTARGLFNATAPIICRQIDASTGEINFQDGATISNNYCYTVTETNPSVLLLGDDPTVVIDENTQINIMVNNESVILTAIDPSIVSVNNPSIMTADEINVMSPEYKEFGKISNKNSTKIINRFQYTILNIINLMVFIVLVIFVVKILVTCVDVCRSLSEGINTEQSLLNKEQIV